MKIAFPAGSTAILLFFLALVTMIKGCAFRREAIKAMNFKNATDVKAITQSIHTATEGLQYGNLWFSATLLLLILGFFCLWIRSRMRRQARLLRASTPQNQPASNQRRVGQRRRR